MENKIIYLIINKNSGCIESISSVYIDDLKCIEFSYLEYVNKYVSTGESITDGYHQYIDGKIVKSDTLLNPKVIEQKKESIRNQREYECFSIINRGPLWYSRLTEEQNNELSIWYNQWLDATDTLVIPERPEWLK